MTITHARRLFAEARRRHQRCPVGEKRKSLDRLIRARTALLVAENERALKVGNRAARKG